MARRGAVIARRGGGGAGDSGGGRAAPPGRAPVGNRPLGGGSRAPCGNLHPGSLLAPARAKIAGRWHGRFERREVAAF